MHTLTFSSPKPELELLQTRLMGLAPRVDELYIYEPLSLAPSGTNAIELSVISIGNDLTSLAATLEVEFPALKIEQRKQDHEVSLEPEK